MYFDDTHLYNFNAEVLEIFTNVLDNNKRNIIVLDESAFYPTSGGQAHDIGKLTIETGGELTVDSTNEEIQEALEAHGRERDIDEVSTTVILTH